MGISAAGTVLEQEFRLDGLAVDRHPGGIGALPSALLAASARPAATTLSRRLGGSFRGWHRYRTRSVAAYRPHARARVTARTARVIQFSPCLLDDCSDDYPPYH